MPGVLREDGTLNDQSGPRPPARFFPSAELPKHILVCIHFRGRHFAVHYLTKMIGLIPATNFAELSMSYDLKTLIDGKRVWGSEVLIVEASQTVSITLHDLQFEFAFKTIENAEPSVGPVLADNKKLRLELINLNNPLGVAWKAEVGSLENAKLMLAICVYHLGQATKLLTVSFSEGAPLPIQRSAGEAPANGQ